MACARASTVFPACARLVPVRGSEAFFPVRRVYCVGQNYEAHAREMGNVDRKPPFFFQKPADAVVTAAIPTAAVSPLRIPYPSMTKKFDYEGELVVAIGATASQVATRDEAMRAVFGYAVGIDFTRRDLQADAKKQGRPWEMGKSFDCSAPMSHIVPASVCPAAPFNGAITLKVNGAVKQSSDISKMVWNVPDMIVELSRFVELQPGDLIFTGTPEGVGTVTVGDTVDVAVEGVAELHVLVSDQATRSKL